MIPGRPAIGSRQVAGRNGFAQISPRGEFRHFVHESCTFGGCIRFAPAARRVIAVIYSDRPESVWSRDPSSFFSGLA